MKILVAQSELEINSRTIDNEEFENIISLLKNECKKKIHQKV